MSELITQIGATLTAAIGWVGDVVSSFFSESGDLKSLLPFLGLSMGIGILGLGVKYVRSFIKIG